MLSIASRILLLSALALRAMGNEESLGIDLRIVGGSDASPGEYPFFGKSSRLDCELYAVFRIPHVFCSPMEWVWSITDSSRHFADGGTCKYSQMEDSKKRFML